MKMSSGWSGTKQDGTWHKFEISVSADEDVAAAEIEAFYTLKASQQFLILRNACEFYVLVELFARACVPTDEQAASKNRLLALKTLIAPYFE